MNQPDAPARPSIRVGDSCFACGMKNSRGLKLLFEKKDQGQMSALWTPDPTLEGFDGIVHGGIVSTVLDESMAKAVAASGAEALTAEIRVRFLRQVVAGSALRASGWITETKKRMIRAEATLTNPSGVELAHAWATFLSAK